MEWLSDQIWSNSLGDIGQLPDYLSKQINLAQFEISWIIQIFTSEMDEVMGVGRDFADFKSLLIGSSHQF